MLDWQWLRRRNLCDGAKQVIVIFTSLLLVGGLYIIGRLFLSLQGMDEGLFTEVVGIVLTVLLIDGLRNIGSDIEIRESLIRRAASTSNETAKAAIDELRKIGLIDRGVLRGADLSGAVLTGAVLTDIDFTNSDLSQAEFPKADFGRSKLVRVVFKKSTFIETKFDTSTILQNANFTGAKLQNCLFNANRNLKGVIFIDAELNEINFDETDLSNAQFGNTTLIATSFRGSTLSEAIFVRYQAMGDSREQPFAAKVSDSVSFERAILHDAILEYVRFEKTNFVNADMSHVKCKGTIFRKVKFQGSNMTGAVLEDASFIDVEFDGATRLPNQETLQDVWNRYDEIESAPQNVEQKFRVEILRYFSDVGVRIFSASISLGKIIQDDKHGREFEDYRFQIDQSDQQPTSRLPKLVESSLNNILTEDEEF